MSSIQAYRCEGRRKRGRGVKEVRYKQSRGRYKSRELNNQAENQAYKDAGANWKVRRRMKYHRRDRE